MENMTQLERGSRSAKYQHIYAEIPTDFLSWGEHLQAEDHAQSAELNELKCQLAEAVFALAVRVLTPHQWEILRLTYQEQKTQCEVAKELGINQASVTKSLRGAVAYGAHYGTRYGGSLRKLARLAPYDPDVRSVLSAISELQGGEPLPPATMADAPSTHKREVTAVKHRDLERRARVVSRLKAGDSVKEIALAEDWSLESVRAVKRTMG